MSFLWVDADAAAVAVDFVVFTVFAHVCKTLRVSERKKHEHEHEPWQKAFTQKPFSEMQHWFIHHLGFVPIRW